MRGKPLGDSARFEAIEMRLAYQDKVIADLNDVIAAQWSKLDTLAREMAILRVEIQDMSRVREATDMPPPHY